MALALRHGNRTAALDQSHRLATREDASFDDRLEHLKLLEKFDDPRFPSFLASVERESRCHADKALALTVLLLECHRVSVANRFLSEIPPAVHTERAVVTARAECLAARGDWQEATKVLADSEWGEEDFVRRAMLTRACRALKRIRQAAREWALALQAASRSPETMTQLARLAGHWGWVPERETVLWNLVYQFPSEIWALDALLEAYSTRLDAHGLNLVYATQVGLGLGGVSAQNNLAATSLLLGICTEYVHDMARAVYATDPHHPAFASTYAWSLHLQGRTAEGIETLNRLLVGQLEMPSIALYYGAMLAAWGVRETARVYLGLAASGILFPEERGILDAANAALH